MLLPLVYMVLGAYPFVEKWVTGDNREHHLLDRPRNAPVRTGIGMAGITAYTVFLFASGNDIMAIKLGMSINDLTWFFRIGLFVLPPLMFWVTKRDLPVAAASLTATPCCTAARPAPSCARPTAGSSSGTRPAPSSRPSSGCSCSTRPWRPCQIEADVDENGVARKAHRKDRAGPGGRGSTSRDAVNPVTPAELAAAHHHGAEHEAIEPSASGGARPIEAAASDDASEVESGEPAGRH